MLIQVSVRRVYGVPTIYPANDAAKLALRLAGKKTFSVEDLGVLKLLGHDVAQVEDIKLEL